MTVISFLATAALLIGPTAARADAPRIEITLPATVALNLAENLAIQVHLRSAEAVSEVALRLDAGNLPPGSVTIETVPDHLSLRAGEEASVELRFGTQSTAPSFAGKRVSFTASARGIAAGRAETLLTVNAVYVVKVIDGDPFSFDRPDATLRFAPHPEGLQFRFENYSSRACVIHGEGAIEHQDTRHPLQPALRGAGGELTLDPLGTYAAPRIFPAAGPDLAGSYTIHDVYHPTRQVVVNATGLTAPRR